MKKLLCSFMAAAIALSVPSTSLAKLIDNPTFKTHYVKFTSPAQKTDANGVEVYVYNPVGGTDAKTNFIRDPKTGKVKITYGASADSDNYGDKKDVLTAIGLYVQLTNNTTAPAVISWKNSSISSGSKNYGVPFLEGMKYVDAGNPSATPDTVIPPGQKLLKRIFIPDVSFVGSRWIHNGIVITPSKDVNMTLVLSVNGQYITNTTPGINFVADKK